MTTNLQVDSYPYVHQSSDVIFLLVNWYHRGTTAYNLPSQRGNHASHDKSRPAGEFYPSQTSWIQTSFVFFPPKNEFSYSDTNEPADVYLFICDVDSVGDVTSRFFIPLFFRLRQALELAILRSNSSVRP